VQVLKDLCRLEKVLENALAGGVSASSRRPADWPVAGSISALMQGQTGTRVGGGKGRAARVADEELAGLREAACAATAAEDEAAEGIGPLSCEAATAWRGVVATAAARIAERRRRNLRTHVVRSDTARGQAFE
jgi:hypothetical protein